MDFPISPPGRSVFFGIEELRALRTLRQPDVSVVVTSPASSLEEVVLIRRTGSNEVIQVHKEAGSEPAFVVTSWQEFEHLRLRHRICMVSPDLDSVVVNLRTVHMGDRRR